jgi:hypothetical protein
MSTAPAPIGNGDIGHIIDALVAADGSGIHAHPASLIAASTAHAARPLHSLADAVHYLCILHGRHPGVIDHAGSRSTDNAARKWLIQATEGFAKERALLTQLSVALGPAPSTSGQNTADTTVLQQRHALDMLAQSDRRGCAMGAAMTLVLDWQAVRRLLDAAALRVGIQPSICQLPNKGETLLLASEIAEDDSVARAIQFGCRQLLSQHRGLWDLLKSRSDIRSAD